ncbi:hypothetical protein [Geobacter sp. DSM 9736]|uniref:hypothetical protein n=1 Tax=Geobacter sp. DSM 9736 TaxID=1277350 RepID=UPI000B5E72ED|nr:hypothetical protein [Geobacter sp. DSM 9736]SNB45692.1 hypothetical protein SAMN06269301_1120 [Geobacter sp. DSM 9736]
MYKELVTMIREEFIDKALQEKTNWGRVQLTEAFDKAVQIAQARLLDSVPCLNRSGR